MKTTQSIIFDIGNVLLTFQPREFIHQILDDAKTADACFELMFHSPEWAEMDRGTLPLEDGRRIFQERNPALADGVELFLNRWLEMFQPIEPMHRLADELKQKGYSIYVLSNFMRESFDGLRDQLGFLEKFDGAVISYQVGLVKPEPAIYKHLLQQFDLRPEECLFIDDMQANVDGALAVGIPSIRFESFLQLAQELWMMKIID